MFNEFGKDDKTQYSKLFCMTWGGDAEVAREMRNNSSFEMERVEKHWDNAGRYWVVFEVETSMTLAEVRKWEEEVTAKFAPESIDADLKGANERGANVKDDADMLNAMERRGTKVAY